MQQGGWEVKCSMHRLTRETSMHAGLSARLLSSILPAAAAHVAHRATFAHPRAVAGGSGQLASRRHPCGTDSSTAWSGPAPSSQPAFHESVLRSAGHCRPGSLTCGHAGACTQYMPCKFVNYKQCDADHRSGSWHEALTSNSTQSLHQAIWQHLDSPVLFIDGFDCALRHPIAHMLACRHLPLHGILDPSRAGNLVRSRALGHVRCYVDKCAGRDTRPEDLQQLRLIRLPH
jgi:hypothetical protein